MLLKYLSTTAHMYVRTFVHAIAIEHEHDRSLVGARTHTEIVLMSRRFAAAVRCAQLRSLHDALSSIFHNALCSFLPHIYPTC
jgi:stress-induced morphogen